MSPQSMWLRDSTRLQQCLIAEPAHVQKDDRGDHVRLIQGALLMLDNCTISLNRMAKNHNTFAYENLRQTFPMPPSGVC